MRKYKFVPAILLLPVLCGPGVQTAAAEVSGFIMPTATAIHVNGNEAKFSEYGDADSNISGGIEIEASGETGFVNFTAEEIALDNQNYKAETGLYGKFKLDAFYKEIQHNNTFDANTIQSDGAGSNQLTSPLNSVLYATAPNPAAAGTFFDYAVSRKQAGAGLSLNLLKPFFANFSFSQEDREGIRPIGSSYQMELPEPVDYKTNILQAEIGYGKDPFFVSLGYTQSKFDNAYDTLYYTNIYTTTAFENNLVSLPPDNDYYKVDLKGRIKMPLKSTLALAYSQAKAEAEANMYRGAYSAGNATRTVNASDDTFDGTVDTTNFSAALTSNPLEFLDGKIFYKNYATKNKSDEITITDAGDYSNALFDYTKKTYGVEVGLNLPGHITLTPGYTKEAKVLPANITTDDKIYSLNAHWKDADLLAAHVGYERLNREDRADTFDTGFGSASALLLAPYTRPFDVASQRRDTYKVGIDVFPSEKLDLGFTMKHQKIEYDETGIGYTGKLDDRYGVSVNFMPNATVSFSAYADYELTTLELLQRRGTITALNASPADTNPADAGYNVTTTQKDKSLDWGLGVNVVAIPKKLTLAAQYDHTRSDGNADFTYGNNSAVNNGIPVGWDNGSIDYANWDDYKKDALSIKATLTLSAHLDLIGGYAYEYYRYTDGQYDNYQYLYQSSATAAGYLSGANADPDYTANVVFLSAKYKF